MTQPGDESGSERGYPYEYGNVICLGPEIFSTRDRSVICWRGENYVPQKSRGRFDAAVKAAQRQIYGAEDPIIDAIQRGSVHRIVTAVLQAADESSR